MAAVLICALAAAPAAAQMGDIELAALSTEARTQGWTFETGANPATELPLEVLCGLKEPADWRSAAPAASIDGSGGVIGASVMPSGTNAPGPLPVAFDWREQTGLPPVRNQGGCGACWAFSTVGALECAIRIKDGIDVNLSEQWLISCNREGWDCNGGWYAHDYHQAKGDPCGEAGAVLESAFPYAAAGRTCACPYPHSYWIDSWAYVDPSVNIPGPEAIKRAIFEHGPVSVGVYASAAFQAYKGGVFNACAAGPVNHSVVLVGWDDRQGAAGAWIVRNSWGGGWGEQGYMRIEYGCCEIGYAACHVHYSGSDELRVLPTSGLTFTGGVGGPFTPSCARYTLTNTGLTALEWTATRTSNWIQPIPSVGTLAPSESVEVFVCTTGLAGQLASGSHADNVLFTNISTNQVRTRPVMLEAGRPDYRTELFDGKDNDLAHHSLLLTPDSSPGGYAACMQPIAALPTEPAGGTVARPGDDGYVEVALAGKSFPFFGQAYTRVFIGSNGYVTFGQSDNSSQETIDGHFDRRRIAALYDDLDPSAGGSIAYRQLADRLAVSWLDVPEFETTNKNTFQVELFFDGRVRCSWLNVAATDGLAGVSRGGGRPTDFRESDLTGAASCTVRAKADFDRDGDIDMDDFARLQGCLTGSDRELQDSRCIDARLDDDGDVDAADVEAFQSCAGGPMLDADPACGR